MYTSCTSKSIKRDIFVVLVDRHINTIIHLVDLFRSVVQIGIAKHDNLVPHCIFGHAVLLPSSWRTKRVLIRRDIDHITSLHRQPPGSRGEHQILHDHQIAVKALQRVREHTLLHKVRLIAIRKPIAIIPNSREQLHASNTDQRVVHQRAIHGKLERANHHILERRQLASHILVIAMEEHSVRVQEQQNIAFGLASADVLAHSSSRALVRGKRQDPGRNAHDLRLVAQHSVFHLFDPSVRRATVH
mmetsp:Transcript_640/g.950  ORF Transcript_640/g.950 Transcript_640/m.950 type:complete len:245 (+) Transcript_640:60-794(+)